MFGYLFIREVSWKYIRVSVPDHVTLCVCVCVCVYLSVHPSEYVCYIYVFICIRACYSHVSVPDRVMLCVFVCVCAWTSQSILLSIRLSVFVFLCVAFHSHVPVCCLFIALLFMLAFMFVLLFCLLPFRFLCFFWYLV